VFAQTEQSRMSITSLASSILTAQAGNTQSQVATTLLKSELDAEKNSVETILGIGQPSLANVGPGVGANVNETA
jgi:Putative motility protein